jgi:hypothetical protein
MDRARQALEDGKQRVRRKAQDVQDAATQRAHAAKQYVHDQAKQKVQQRQGQLATTLQDAADAVRSAGQTLHDRDDDTVANYLDVAADRVGGAAKYLQQSDPGDILDDGRALMRRYPELTLAGMFVAGLAVSRFLKSTERERDQINEPAVRQRPPASNLADAQTHHYN